MDIEKFETLIRDINIPLQTNNILENNYIYDGRMAFYDISQIKQDSKVVEYIKKYNYDYIHKHHQNTKIILIMQPDNTTSIYQSIGRFNLCSIVGLVHTSDNSDGDSELLYKYGKENIRALFELLRREHPRISYKLLNELAFKMYYHPYCFCVGVACFSNPKGPEIGIFGEKIYDNTRTYRYSMKQYMFGDNELNEVDVEKYLIKKF